MRDINNVEVRAVSGGLDRTDAASLLGAFVCKDMFAGSFGYAVGGVDLGAGLATFGGVVVGAVAGRLFDHVVNDHVFPITDSVTP